MRKIIFLVTAFLLFGVSEVYAAPQINNVTDTGDTFKYEKFEATFDVENTTATNLQLPYDSNPPIGINPIDYPKHKGVSVDAYFLPPNETDWNNAYAQPGFFYRNYDYALKDHKSNGLRDWFHPTSEAWKVRFAPNELGNWQYKLSVQDDSGTFETAPSNFTVSDSDNKGFVKVSETDPRYFEYDDGTLFYFLGFQNPARFADPISSNEPFYDAYGANDVKFVRTWISGIYGAAWPEFEGAPGAYDGYLPRPRILPFRNEADGKESMTIHIDYELEGNTGWFTNCAWQRWDDPEAVKQNTNYRIRLKYRAMDITGPRDSGNPNYGVVIKNHTGTWTEPCSDPNSGTAISNFGQNNDDWGYLETTWNSESNDWLTKLYIVLENVNEGNVYLDSIAVQEDLGSGQYGPDIMVEGDFQFDLNYPDPSMWSLDQLFEMMEENDVTLKMVIGDKSDKMWWKIDDDGTYVIEAGESDNTTGYYGNWYNSSTNYSSRQRWLQRAYWRYLQARYGYSTSLHSWEFTNEGDPVSGKHWSATDLLGRYMSCEVFGVATPDTNGDGMSIEYDKCVYDHPNSHMVSTSFWHSFPTSQFWGNDKWPNINYADVHKYTNASSDPNHEIDTASFHLDYSGLYREELDAASTLNGIATKPIVRGELGLSGADDLLSDTQGVWLHNLTWASLSPGAMYDLYWQLRKEIDTPLGPDGQPGLYEVYKYFSDFVSNIPLNNGNYLDAEALITDSNLRITGQKDIVNNRAHVWVQNTGHTWRKVVDGTDITGLGGTVSLSGFTPNQTMVVEMHEFTTQGTPNITTSSARTDSSGDLILSLPSDSAISDVGIKIGDYVDTGSTPTPIPSQLGDTDGDGDVDIFDYNTLLTQFGQSGSGLSADFDTDGDVDIFDYNTLLANFGT